MNRLLTALARAAIPGLHLIVISRSYPEIPIEELILKGICLELSQAAMEYNAAETAELFALNGFHPDEGEREALSRITDGWTAAVYLALLKYAEDRTLDDITEITRLMKSAVYDRPYENERTLSEYEGFELMETIAIENRIVLKDRWSYSISRVAYCIRWRIRTSPQNTLA
jgi:LuxR family maltose regulon positive regulatory protein